jgi:hypothetical protein
VFLKVQLNHAPQPEEPANYIVVIDDIAQLPDLIDRSNDDEQLELVNESPVPNQEEISLILDELLAERGRGGLADSPERPWRGQNGVMPEIRKALGIQKSVDIANILEDVVECKRLVGQKYNGDRRVDPNKKLGGRPII